MKKIYIIRWNFPRAYLHCYSILASKNRKNIENVCRILREKKKEGKLLEALDSYKAHVTPTARELLEKDPNMGYDTVLFVDSINVL